MAWQNQNQTGWNPEVAPMLNPAPAMPMVVMPTGQPGMPPGGVHPQYTANPQFPMGQPGIPPIMTPPAGGWPMPNSNCPPGLEYLMGLDRLMVDQQVELLEAFTGWESENRYVVKNSAGQLVYYVAEETGCCNRQCCGSSRSFDMRIVDSAMKEVIHLYRPLRASSCCFPCCLQELTVSSNGQTLGTIVQHWNPFRPSFSVVDSTGDSVLKIKGPICMCPCYDIDFEILSRDGDQQVGRISKKWSGLAREVFTNADVFGISFPVDLDVKVKALLLGACFLIDFMYFESSANDN